MADFYEWRMAKWLTAKRDGDLGMPRPPASAV
jgi:hypothetical protein